MTSTSSMKGSYTESYMGPPTSATLSRSPMERVGVQRLGCEVDTEARSHGREVVATTDVERLHEVFVQMAGVLDHAVVEAGRHPEIVEHREVLHVLAEPDA